MLTMGKVAAAATLAGTGYLASTQVMQVWEEDFDFGLFPWVSAAIGAWAGWTIIGRRVTRRSSAAQVISYGLTGLVMMLLVAFFVFAGNEALRKSLARRYDGPIEAILDMIPISTNWGANLLHPHILATLVAGGLVSAVMARVVDRIWK
ncbi:hypothetical protein PSM7751_00833 [Pseudooceanicola marinus]|uniref:TrgA family protein n=1 Tax=Pseudooceanicola marinus TaxID=396013 RepID=A0A1X6YLT6_9RHOB|nr:TrgA family protein [Pseudooceanicola marinus]PJE29330.1 hypothetical protein CVM50_12505 [Pseudooceanicola marinus]SLN24571.1 hypothetical protein PSM7751_00833 [Pseudooceanicola marinus]